MLEHACWETALCVFMWVSAYAHVDVEVGVFLSHCTSSFGAGSLMEPGVTLSAPLG